MPGYKPPKKKEMPVDAGHGFYSAKKPDGRITIFPKDDVTHPHHPQNSANKPKSIHDQTTQHDAPQNVTPQIPNFWKKPKDESKTGQAWKPFTKPSGLEVTHSPMRTFSRTLDLRSYGGSMPYMRNPSYPSYSSFLSARSVEEKSARRVALDLIARSIGVRDVSAKEVVERVNSVRSGLKIDEYIAEKWMNELEQIIKGEHKMKDAPPRGWKW